MSPKLNWGDIAGGATLPPGKGSPGSAGAGMIPAAESPGESAPTMVERANDFLDSALDMIRKIDQVVGIFLELKGKTTIEGEKMPPRGDQDLPQGKGNPGSATPGPDAILALLDRIIEAEGDIPLSKFVAAIRNQEAWLTKYAAEIAEKQSAE